jgi:hypothetical protein
MTSFRILIGINLRRWSSQSNSIRVPVREKTITSKNCLKNLIHSTDLDPDLDPQLEKKLDPDPHYINADLKSWF